MNKHLPKKKISKKKTAIMKAVKNSLLYIPSNPYSVKIGYYTLSNFVKELRKHKNNPDAIQFIADMLEE